MEKTFDTNIDTEMSNFVDTFETKLQNKILTTVAKIFTPRIEIAVRSRNSSSGRDATSVTSNSEREERIGITGSFENVFERNNTFDELNVNDETVRNIPDEESELCVPGMHFDRQPHFGHNG